MFRTAALIGGTYWIGSLGGRKIAEAANVKTDATRTAVQIGTGVVAFFVLSSVLR